MTTLKPYGETTGQQSEYADFYNAWVIQVYMG
jgi:hypothetical protein